LPHFSHIQDGICFRCMGAGIVRAKINFLSEEIVVGSDRIPVEPYAKMTRKKLIEVLTHIFELGDKCNDGYALATLGMILGLADKTLRDRGFQAFDKRCSGEDDRSTLREITNRVFAQWGSLRKT
jgi:hypothetical protein